MGIVKDNTNAVVQGPTLMQQMMAQQTKQKFTVTPVNNAAKKKKASGGVKISRLGIGIKDDDDFKAPEKRQPNKRHQNQHGAPGGFTDDFSGFKQSSHTTQAAIKRYQRPDFSDLDYQGEDESENPMHIKSTHSQISRPIKKDEDEELEELYQTTKSTSQLGWGQKIDIKKEFPTLEQDSAQNTFSGIAPMFQPKNKTVKVEKSKKKGSKQQQPDEK